MSVVEPQFYGYQLIGDSQFLRFSEHILRKPRKKKDGLAYLGFCVSGQKTSDLRKRIDENFYYTSSRVILMIGTNDLLQSVECEKMKINLKYIIAALKDKGMEKLIILTVPPVPRLVNSYEHWSKLLQFNDQIRSFNSDRDIYVVDIYPKFILPNKVAEYDSDSSFYSCYSSSSKNSSPTHSQNSSFVQIPDSPRSNTSTPKSGLRIQVSNNSFSGVKRKVFCLENDDDTSSHNDSSEFKSPPPKRRSYNSSLADDDHNDKFCEEDSRPDIAADIKLEYFEEYYSGSDRKDLIHINLRGFKVIKDLVLRVLKDNDLF